MVTPGEILRDARRRNGVSQQRLARRAGTTQSAISRIERDRVSPTVATLRHLLELLDEDLVIVAGRRDTGIDLSLNEATLELSPSGRIERGLGFAEMVRRDRGEEDPSAAAQSDMAQTDLGADLELHHLLGSLLRQGVDLVVVGGVAGWVHGSVYPTHDLDVAYARDGHNLERLAAALADVRARWRRGPPDLPIQLDAAMLRNGANFTFDTRFGPFDVVGQLSGVGSYDELRREARIETYKGLGIRVASLDHLIAMKRAADRPKDKLMVLEYVALANRERGQEESG